MKSNICDSTIFGTNKPIAGNGIEPKRNYPGEICHLSTFFCLSSG